MTGNALLTLQLASIAAALVVPVWAWVVRWLGNYSASEH